ncbi:MAG: 16S rRNA processing protein RimM [Robiginitomaculum sp.]|nr:MAG: 16S rRNA processing protein RimM [Robiginitomaculum sp.]
MSNPKDPLICIASCSGAFGVKGEVKIRSFTGVPEACLDYGDWRDEQGEIVLCVTQSRPIKNAFAVRCKGITTPEQAQALNGTKLYVYRSDMPEPDEEEFYFEDLIGLDVKTTEGKRMGKIMAVHNYGAGDLLEISGGKDKKGNPLGAFFHPFTQVGVPVVDIKGKRIVIFIEETVSERDKD